MVQKKINLCFIYPDGEEWTGEINYLNSLITSLQYIDKKKLNLYIFSSEKRKKILSKFINKKSIISSSFFENYTLKKYFRSLMSSLTNNDIILRYLTKKYDIDLISHYIPTKNIPTISWIPDFQHLYYRNFFTREEYSRRQKLFSNFVENSRSLIVSSRDSYKTLIKKYKKKKNFYVLKFVPYIKFQDIKKFDIIKKKYNLDKNYIYIPNQFWKHKNHSILVTAARILKKKNIKFNFVISGNSTAGDTYDNYKSFVDKINKYKLKDYFSLLGFIPYSDVINLIYHCKILINPSLFEGWSTTVEEGKLLNKKMILSNIKVHKEQADGKAWFFDPHEPRELVNKILRHSSKIKKKIKISDLKKKYYTQRTKFAKQYLKILYESL